MFEVVAEDRRDDLAGVQIDACCAAGRTRASVRIVVGDTGQYPAGQRFLRNRVDSRRQRERLACPITDKVERTQVAAEAEGRSTPGRVSLLLNDDPSARVEGVRA